MSYGAISNRLSIVSVAWLAVTASSAVAAARGPDSPSNGRAGADSVEQGPVREPPRDARADRVAAKIGTVEAGAAPEGSEVERPVDSAAKLVDGIAARIRLANVEGAKDPATAPGRADELVLQSRESTDLRTTVDLLSAAANTILAHELEPACTAELLGIAGSPSFPSRDLISASLDRADAVLAEAKKSMAQISPPPEASDDWARRASANLNMMEAFAAALRAYLLGSDGAEGIESADRAASGLAAHREDRRPEVAAAATLWQASIRAREADLSRVTSALDLVLSHPRPGTLPYSFFTRLLRCKVIASGGGYAAAVALLTQLEERCDSWFTDASVGADALRAIALVQVHVLKDWMKTLGDGADSRQSLWCAERIKALSDERLTGDEVTVYRLVDAIPVVATSQDAARRQSPSPDGAD